MTAVLAVRLAHDVRDVTVNVLWWDQWDFWSPLFRDADAWTMFRWQHGPQRQGFGELLTAAIARVSRWDVRAEAAVAILLVTLACIAALLLARRLRGHWAVSDAVIPLIFLTFSQYEIFGVAPNLSHGPLPLLFVTCFALAATIERPRVRIAALVATGVLGIETGFGVLLAFVALPLVAALLWDAIRRRRDIALHAVALAVLVGAVLLYLDGLVIASVSAVQCFRFPDPEPLRYVPFIARYFLRPFEMSRLLARWPRLGLATGMALAVACAGLAVWGAFGVIGRRGRAPLQGAVLVLAGFALLFAANAAIGRTCLGPDAANAPRYVTYQVPFLLATYLALATGPASRTRGVLIGLFALACVVKELPPMQFANHVGARRIADGKRAWSACYRASGDLRACQTTFEIYPRPQATGLEQKLMYLRSHHLNLFKN